MDTQNQTDKIWYHVDDIKQALGIAEGVLWHTIVALNINTRSLPGLTGSFIHKDEFEVLKLKFKKQEGEQQHVSS